MVGMTADVLALMPATLAFVMGRSPYRDPESVHCLGGHGILGFLVNRMHIGIRRNQYKTQLVSQLPQVLQQLSVAIEIDLGIQR